MQPELAGRQIHGRGRHRAGPLYPATRCALELQDRREIVASALVGFDGSFTATFGPTMRCTGDTLPDLAVELRVRLRYCNSSSYCFSINRSAGNPVHAVASGGQRRESAPGSGPGNEITVAAMNFSTAADPSKPNNDSIRSPPTTTRRLSIPCWRCTRTAPDPVLLRSVRRAPVHVFPSTLSSTATTKTASLVVISTYQSQPTGSAFAWVDGKTPAHRVRTRADAACLELACTASMASASRRKAMRLRRRSRSRSRRDGPSSYRGRCSRQRGGAAALATMTTARSTAARSQRRSRRSRNNGRGKWPLSRTFRARDCWRRRNNWLALSTPTSPRS